ncbi:SAM-dependent methyltransferase [Nonomuraea sp. SYSU D8015]|uniref:SAM-dependent methyltransferase n=1 Tax=Nonomuraea sp. SYSU D8015 TaxID=2593644 RepID=UPI001661870F|nr:SAM-dependent methyltransferase [Nonomuraea sp. SYSU D8015]
MTAGIMWAEPPALPEVDSYRPNAARVHDCLLGGKDHYLIDCQAAEAMETAAPGTHDAARADREFLIRAATWAAERGHTQFLELGTGFPSQPNVHEAVQAVQPDAQVVYVDHDDVVVAHARALLARVQANVGVVQDDVRDLPRVLAGAARWIDFSRPVVVSLVGILHFVADADDPADIIATLQRHVAPGSVLIVSHLCSDAMEASIAETVAAPLENSRTPLVLRTGEQIAALLSGLTLYPHGACADEGEEGELVEVSAWRPPFGRTPKPTGVVQVLGAVADLRPASRYHMLKAS